METGVYKIENIKTGQFYIGSTKRTFTERWRQHRYTLKAGKHHNSRLQHVYDKYGPEVFRFSVLHQCDPSIAIEKEQEYIDSLKPEYNLKDLAGGGMRPIFSNEKKLAVIMEFINTLDSKDKIAKRFGLPMGSTGDIFNGRFAGSESIITPRIKRQLYWATVFRSGVHKIDQDGNIIATFATASEVEKSYRQRSCITVAMNTKTSYDGHWWCRIKDYSDMDFGKRRTRKQNKRLICFSRDGQKIRSFETLTAAGNHPDYTRSGISQCLTGATKTYKGLRWLYEEDWDGDQLAPVSPASNSKALIRVSLADGKRKMFSSGKDALQNTPNSHRSRICLAANGRIESHAGYTWQYA